MVKLERFKNEDRHDEFKQGQTFFQKGDAGGPMYVVLQGNVTLSINGREVERLEAGGVLGEMALIDTSPRSASAVAASNCRLEPTDQRPFTFLIQQTPNFAPQIMRIIVDRLRRMDQKL